MKLLTLWTLGLTPTITAVRSSSGAHTLQPGFAVSGAMQRGPLAMELELGMSSWQESQLDTQARLTLLRPAALVGVRAGEGPASVGLYAGPAAAIFLAESGTLARPAVRVRGDLSKDLGERWSLGGQAGLTQRGRSGDLDLGLRVGVRW